MKCRSISWGETALGESQKVATNISPIGESRSARAHPWWRFGLSFNRQCFRCPSTSGDGAGSRGNRAPSLHSLLILPSIVL